MRGLYLKLPKFLRSIIAYIYYNFYFVGWLRSCVRYFRVYLLHQRNRKVIKELRMIIALAKQNNQPIFVQFPVIPWDLPLFQRPQQFAKAMSEIGYLTIYLLPLMQKPCPIKQISNNLFITDQFEILSYLENAIVSVYLNYPAGYLDKYLTQQFFDKNKVFYEYVDHIDENIWGIYFSRILKKRFELIKIQHFNLIIGTSRVLYEELLEYHSEKKVMCLPNAVDVSHYNLLQKSNNKPYNLPNRLKEAIARGQKIIGYFGAIAPWIWNELIIELAEKRPNYFILMIGPDYGKALPFPEKENLYFTGPVNYNDLPFYAHNFDVSIIPFRLGDIAKATSPLKLFEYFAIGKPIVVTSDLIECTQFDGVASASTIQEFIEKVYEAVELGCNEELRKKYLQYAHDNSWTTRAKELSKFFNI